MKIDSNHAFKKLLVEFNLPEDFSFSVEFPDEVLKILSDEIVQNENGIGLRGMWNPKVGNEYQSYIEDYENHFHVEDLIEPSNNKLAFKLGVKTLIALAENFKKNKFSGIRFTYSFSTPEMSKTLAEEKNFHHDGDEYFISDRLSFYTMRENDDFDEMNNFQHDAVLTIEI